MGRPTIQTIEEYIAQFPPEVQTKLVVLRKLIRETAPMATERFAWGLPTYYQKGLLLEFAALKNHIALYCPPSTIQYLGKEIKPYKGSAKNTIQFPLDQELPLELIEKIIRHRLKENGS